MGKNDRNITAKTKVAVYKALFGITGWNLERSRDVIHSLLDAGFIIAPDPIVLDDDAVLAIYEVGAKHQFDVATLRSILEAFVKVGLYLIPAPVSDEPEVIPPGNDLGVNIIMRIGYDGVLIRKEGFLSVIDIDTQDVVFRSHASDVKEWLSKRSDVETREVEVYHGSARTVLSVDLFLSSRLV